MVDSFTIDGTEVRYYPIKTAENKFSDCDSKGTLVFSESQKAKQTDKKATTKKKFYYADGTEYTGKTYKLIDEKAKDRALQTKVVEKYVVVDKLEAIGMFAKHGYFCDMSKLLKDKIADDKALKFIFNTGGFDTDYYGYIFQFGKHYYFVLGVIEVENALNQIAEQLAKVETTTKELKPKEIVVRAESRLKL